MTRLAIVPFENLSSNARLDWIGRAAADAIVYNLSGSATLFPQTADSVSAAYASSATQVLTGYYFERNGRLEIRVTEEDLKSTKVIRTYALGDPLAEGALPAINELSKRLSPAARPFGTNNAEAYRDYGEGLSAADPEKRRSDFQAATIADPHFTEAYLGWAQALLAAGDRDAALQVIATAKGGQTSPLEHAKLDYLAASVNRNNDARVKAVEALTRAAPADLAAVRELAELQYLGRRFRDAVRSYTTVVRLDPADAAGWNQLGYASAFAGDLEGARQALGSYQKLLPPGDGNALDSLGEVSFFSGDFDSAAKYFVEAHDKNPSVPGGGELWKAAQARLMTGDLTGADGFFQRYLGTIGPAQRSIAALQQAQWEFATGREKAALARIEKLLPALEGDLESLASSQLSIWMMLTGDQPAAAKLAEQAAKNGSNPQIHNMAIMCQVIAAGMTGVGSPVTDAYSLLFARKFAQAAPLLERLYRETNPAQDGQFRTLLAWTWVETGKVSEASALLRLYPIPFSSGEQLFAPLLFPRYLYLRGVTLQKEGKASEAKAAYQLYLKYAGDMPDIFGEEAIARKNLDGL